MKPVAQPTPDTQAWFDHIDAEQLTVPRCRACDHRFLYPRMCCPACSSRDVELVPASGTGRIASFVVNHRGPGEFAEDTPYVLALVALAEGPLLMATVRTDDPTTVAVDQPVRVAFAERGERRVVEFVVEEDAA
ncbi:OB-fold domain-containing protein [Nocardioides panacisoli]|uniref:Zn-ribbon domain-containing OB-fold protein n=1 Tax=Nocardioides panacisoli TaxID=627624 RepID=UPI001C62B186|nr:OB-fold domain-containing protein [Nocardioides panacisoli]QYJ03621.1 OB-fold domain-containing protein [Nocardioides panacisoli]